MKKIFAVLAIMLVIIGAAFAAEETHTIKIKADVAEVVPAFQLELLSPATSYTTNDTPNVFANAAAYNGLTEGTAKDVNFNLDQNGTVTVQCNLANLAKTNKSYTLTFGGGDFAVKRQGTDGIHSPSSVVSSAGANVVDTYTCEKGDGDGNQPITVNFLGKTVQDASAVLATCVYSYTGDSTIDPNVNGSFYYADITLTVSTV